MIRHEVCLALPVGELPAALAAAAAEWGAEWRSDGAGREGGRLVLPVVFGLRRGVLIGRVEFEPAGDGARISWNLEETHLHVQRASVAVLVFAVVALLPALAWPFQPQLMALLPFAVVMGLLAWWLVLSRLETSGPEEFFATLDRGASARLRARAPCGST